MATSQILDLAALRARDEGQMRLLFEYLYPRLRRYAQALGGSQRTGGLDAEDLAHQTIISIYQSLDRILLGFDETAGSPEQFLFHYSLRVLRNKSIDQYRSLRRTFSVPLPTVDPSDLDLIDSPGLGTTLHEPVDPTESVETQIARQERLEQALAVLSDRDSELLKKYYSDLNHEDLAKELGISVNALRVYILRLTRRLRAALETEV